MRKEEDGEVREADDCVSGAGMTPYPPGRQDILYL